MTMNSSGPISLAGATAGQSIALEIQQSPTAQISLNDPTVRDLAGVYSGAITMPTNFWGTTYFQISLVSGTTYTSTVAPTAVYWWKVDGVGTATYLAQAASYVLPWGYQMFASKDAAGLLRSNVVGKAAVAQFFYTGGDQTLTIPSTYVVGGVTETVTSAQIEIWGAGGQYAGYTRFDDGVVGTTYHMIVGAAGGSKIAGAMQMYYNADYYGYQVGCAFVSTIWPYDGSLNYLPTDDSTLIGVAGGSSGTSSGYGGGLVGGNGSGYAGVTGGTQSAPGNMGDGRGGAAWYGPGKLTGGTFVGSQGCSLAPGAGGYYPGGPINIGPCGTGYNGAAGSGFIHAGTGETYSTQNSGFIAPPNFGQGSNGLILVYYNYA